MGVAGVIEVAKKTLSVWQGQRKAGGKPGGFASRVRTAFRRFVGDGKGAAAKDAGDEAGRVFPDDASAGAETASVGVQTELGEHERVNLDVVRFVKKAADDLHAQLLEATGDSGSAEFDVQAFEAAGARSVLFSGWLVDETARGKLLFSFYESQNRDIPPALSLTDARRSMRDSDERDYFQPSWWAQYILSGRH